MLQPVVAPGGTTVAITHAGDARLFLADQTGVIRIFDGQSLLPTPFLDIQSVVLNGGERGLLSVAFHPNYLNNGFFFVNYTRQPDGATVIARYHVSADADVANPGSGLILLTIAQDFSNHNGGQIQFGPDGKLYIGMGDGGSGNDPNCRAQATGSLLGKLLRIDVDQNVNSAPFHGIPNDNPFINGPYLPAVWAVGLRNPWRFSFDRVMGDLYIADVGQGAVEEIDFQPTGAGRGANYGWKMLEGNRCVYSDPEDSIQSCPGEPVPPACSSPIYTAPVVSYSHTNGNCSVTGGYVYRGQRLPQLNGRYLYGDYCSGTLWAAARDQTGRWATETLALTAPGNLYTFGEDAQGEVYLSTGGTVYRLGDGGVFQDAFESTP